MHGAVPLPAHGGSSLDAAYLWSTQLSPCARRRSGQHALLGIAWRSPDRPPKAARDSGGALPSGGGASDVSCLTRPLCDGTDVR